MTARCRTCDANWTQVAERQRCPRCATPAGLRRVTNRLTAQQPVHAVDWERCGDLLAQRLRDHLHATLEREGWYLDGVPVKISAAMDYWPWEASVDYDDHGADQCDGIHVPLASDPTRDARSPQILVTAKAAVFRYEE